MFAPAPPSGVRRLTTALAACACLVGAACVPGQAQARTLRAPSAASPARGAAVQALPAFHWKAVRGADRYEFQLAADDRFGSIVIGRGKGSFQTRNTWATVPESLADSTYHWRVRAINKADHAGRWSAPRSLRKAWTDRPALLGPDGGDVSWPSTPLVLHWTPIAAAFKYQVTIATDPTLSSPVVATAAKPVLTSGTVFAPQGTLAPGRYYWAVTPVDADGHKGTRSAVGVFTWSWLTRTATAFTDLHSGPQVLNPQFGWDASADGRVLDPQFSWDPIAGAARYEVEVSFSQDFAPGSKVCCDDPTTGTSLSPRNVLTNNRYYWRVRAVDTDGSAGEWNPGPEFVKDFDNVTPSIPNLRFTGEDSVPIVEWDPVAGASSYEVQVVPYAGGCNWTAVSPRWDVVTAATAWTPLSPNWNGKLPGGVSYPSASKDSTRAQLVPDGNYCVRVLAQSDRDQRGARVVSNWSYVRGSTNPAFAFTYKAPPVQAPGPLVMTAGSYLGPQTGSFTPRLPLFRWTRVPGAKSYFVVVARDSSFTEIEDVAITQVPAYAPRMGPNPQTYPDETTTYYWAVVPATGVDGNGVSAEPKDSEPRSFEKRSVPPELIAPVGGTDVTRQPSFRWSAAEGARTYRLQVAQDPSFRELTDDVTTASTAYTSSSTYPADTVVYWRVRVTDERGIGLAWSNAATFRRRLPATTPAPGNPAGGETHPVLSWNPVEGAVSYEMLVDQVDGTSKTFTLRSTSFTPTTFYGTGVWNWRVRANFPKGLASAVVGGGFSDPLGYTRTIGAPGGAIGLNRRNQMLLTWRPYVSAEKYRVEISTSDSFTQLVDSIMTTNTSWAPRLTAAGFGNGGKLYWRVAATDEGGNVGAWSSGTFILPKALRVEVTGRPVGGVRGRLQVKVTDTLRRAVRTASVRIKGRGVRGRKRTSRKGAASFVVHPRRRGSISVTAKKKGYRSTTVSVRVG